MSVLDAAYTATRARIEAGRGKEDFLTAAFHVVEALPESDCRALLDEVYGKPLVRTDADVVQMIVARLGVAVEWRHWVFNEDVFREGRGER